MNQRTAAAALVAWAFSFHAALAADAHGSLDAFIKRNLQADDIVYRVAETDLDGDGVRETIVYVTSPDYCGSGGCLTLVLKRAGENYRIVMRATVVQLPIRVLDTRHHGWKDIGLMVGGGGITSPYEAVLAFDGRRYPSNPTVSPARRLRHFSGTIVIGEPR